MSGKLVKNSRSANKLRRCENHACVFLCVCVPTCLCVYKHVCVCVCTHVCACMCVCVHIWVIGSRRLMPIENCRGFPKIVSVLALRVTSIFIGFTNRFFYCSPTAHVPILAIKKCLKKNDISLFWKFTLCKNMLTSSFSFKWSLVDPLRDTY